jgi:phosphatidylglycerophosphatase A
VSERRAGPAVWIATCLGVGYFPVAPGTAGSAVGVSMVAAIGLLPLSRSWQITIIAAIALGLSSLGVWAASAAEKFFERADPGQVVIDEVVGQMLTLLLWPGGSWRWWLGGFFLFRLLDMVKPFPARQLEHASGGWGIMLDDIAAGTYGLGLLALLGWALKSY